MTSTNYRDQVYEPFIEGTKLYANDNNEQKAETNYIVLKVSYVPDVKWCQMQETSTRPPRSYR